MNQSIGRFAPSPTGPLHMGSLVAALGSYLHVKQKNGKWLVRMEDLDPPREQAGAAGQILAALEAHGLFWDDEVLYQSTRHEAYEEVIETLLQNKLAYHCSCSRKKLLNTAKSGDYGLIYPGTCRKISIATNLQSAIRVQCNDFLIQFVDQRVGIYGQRLESELGDFIIKRADGFYAYQLAVVIDDAWQGITEVVRGVDLLDNTPRQIHLQRLLGFSTPNYLHLPVVKNDLGQKLSKQTHAKALDTKKATENLIQALKFLGLTPPDTLHKSKSEDVVDWALEQRIDFGNFK